MHSSTVPSNAEQSNETEISLIDIFLFLKRFYKTIVFTGALGLTLAAAYLWLVPNQYEASANIAVGKATPGGPNLEEPQALINRMSIPTSLDGATLQACSLQDSNNSVMPSVAKVNKAIKLSIPKGVANVVELKVTQPSIESARACANGVIEVVANSQLQMIGPMAQATKAANSSRLAKVEERLVQDKGLLAKAGDPKNTVSPTYFALLSEIRSLEDERDKLQATVDANTVQTATLQSPIFVSDKPVYPKKILSLIVGLFGGLFLGILIALARQVFPKFKAQMRGAV